MDVNRFTATLASRLEAAGADRESAMRQAQTFVSSMPEAEAAKIAALGDNEDMMERITSSLIRRIGVKAAAPSDVGGAGNNADSDDDDYDGVDEMLESSRETSRQPTQPRQSTGTPRRRPAADSQPVRRPQQNQPQQQQLAPQATQQQVPIHQPPVQPQQKSPSQERRIQQLRPGEGRQRPVKPVQRQMSQTQSKPKPETGALPETERDTSGRRVIYKPDPNADYRKFYIILACSSPLWGFVALLGAAAFVFAIGAMAASIVLIIAAIFVGVALGTTLALVGIIYGITQLFEYAPIGTYEIGLGIMIGGFVMLLGVLAYNAAVRLMPYLIKQVIVLLSFTIHKCVELYYYVKGRCADL